MPDEHRRHRRVLIGQWPEAAMVMFLFNVAELIEARSLDRARNAIRGLLDLAPETATVRQANGDWLEVPAAKLQVGDIVRVRPGERIAADGIIVSGSSAVDQSPSPVKACRWKRHRTTRFTRLP